MRAAAPGMPRSSIKAPLATLTAVCLMPLVAVAQQWKVYEYPDAGFAVQFPVPPVVAPSTFRTSAGVSLPMTRYAAREDRVLYTMSVVDFSGVNEDATSVIAETEKSFGASGRVTVAIDARINRQFGRELSVNGADGARSAVAIFFASKHLYLLVGESLPPNAIARSGDAIRFQESLQFIGPNGGFGGFGRFAGRGRFGGGFNPRALAACQGKAAGDTVQLDTPRGPVQATCVLVARPNRPPL